MPRGVVVARQPLELESLVRAQAGQPRIIQRLVRTAIVRSRRCRRGLICSESSWRWLMAGEPEIPEQHNESDSQRAGFSVPRWASPGGGPGGRPVWRSGLRRKLVWLAAALLLLFALWSSYPFVPNPWVALFRQPSGDASAVSAPGRWAMHGGNLQGTNFVPAAAAPQGVIGRVIEVGAGVRSAAAVADGVAYIGGQSRVVAFDAATGQQIWERPISVPAITENALYLGTLNNQVIALDRVSGRTLWEYEGVLLSRDR